MTKLAILLFFVLVLIGCEDLKDVGNSRRDGVPISENDPGATVKTINIWADFDLNSCCARVSQIKGLMILPDFFNIRDLPENHHEQELKYVQVEVLDYNRAVMIASVCYVSIRGNTNFEYKRTLLEYGDCTDDVSWTRDQSTFSFRIEKPDVVRVTGFGDFSGIRNQFVLNVATYE